MLLIPGIIASSVAVGGDFESIATVVVGSGGAANIQFTSIPGDYQHLQIRAHGTTTTAGGRQILFQLNGDTGNNYNAHQLYGSGSGAAVSSAKGTGNSGWFSYWDTANLNSAIFDVLDYSNTNKNTTTRSIGGHDLNGSGFILLRSGLWVDTSAVTSIQIYPDSGNFAQHTHMALYGIKG